MNKTVIVITNKNNEISYKKLRYESYSNDNDYSRAKLIFSLLDTEQNLDFLNKIETKDKTTFYIEDYGITFSGQIVQKSFDKVKLTFSFHINGIDFYKDEKKCICREYNQEKKVWNGWKSYSKELSKKS